MNKKKKMGLFSLLVCTTLLSACKPPLWFIEDDTNSKEYKDRQQLVFAHQWQRGSANYNDFNNLIKTFNDSDIAKELNVYIKGDGINFWDYWDKVNLSISGGKAPDIFIHAVSSTPTRLNLLLNLTDMYEEDVRNNRETLNANEMFFESQVHDIARYSEDNDLYAWPFSSTVRVIYYNKTLFDEAGITTLPKTWEELDEVSKKLTIYNTEGEVASGYKQVGFDPFCAEGQYIHQWGWLAGHNYWTTDETTGRPVPHFDDQKHIENLEKIANSYARRDETARKNLENFFSKYSANGQNPFISGRLGMMVSNEGFYTTLKEAKVNFEYGVFELPSMDENIKATNWSSSYSIELYDNAKRDVSSEVAEQRNRGSWEFLKFLYQKEAQSVIAKTGFMIPNRKFYNDFVYSDPILTELSNAIANTRESEYIAAAPNWTADIQTYINSFYANDNPMTLEEALKASQKLLESKIDQYYSVHN